MDWSFRLDFGLCPRAAFINFRVTEALFSVLQKARCVSTRMKKNGSGDMWVQQ